MKKVLALMLCDCIVFSLDACGIDKNIIKDDHKGNVEQTEEYIKLNILEGEGVMLDLVE